MNFVESIKTCFVKYATFSGRASRSEFWYFTLFYLILDVSTEVLDAALAGESFWSYDEFFGPISSVFYIVTTLPAFAVSFRRLQDINKSGWWAFIFLTIIGIVPLTYWYATKGMRGSNDYGEDPLKHLSDEETGKITPKWVNYILIPVGSVIFAAGLLGLFLMEAGVILDAKVYKGSDLQEHHRTKLFDQKILSSDEEIKFFYTTGLFSILEDGQLMTDSRVISYTENAEGEIEIYPMLLANIKEINLVEEGDFLDDVYRIIGNENADYEYITIVLPHDDENSESFINGLKEAIN